MNDGPLRPDTVRLQGVVKGVWESAALMSAVEPDAFTAIDRGSDSYILEHSRTYHEANHAIGMGAGRGSCDFTTDALPEDADVAIMASNLPPAAKYKVLETARCFLPF